MSFEHQAQDITKGFHFAIPHQLQPGATGADDGIGFTTPGTKWRQQRWMFTINTASINAIAR